MKKIRTFILLILQLNNISPINYISNVHLKSLGQLFLKLLENNHIQYRRKSFFFLFLCKQLKNAFYSEFKKVNISNFLNRVYIYIFKLGIN